ncbi:MAG: hypothetical protein OWQ57_02100 [Sulfobacillus sp.]|nr:hypothetical protein [Sulfobacillus sp.]
MESRTDIARRLAALAAAALVGAAVMNAHTAAEHDQLRLALTKARRQSDAWEAEARNLQRQLAAINERQAKTLYVRSVRLDIVEPSPVSSLDVRLALRPETEALVGQPVSLLNPDLVFRLFDRRMISVGHQLYQTHVLTLVIAPQTLIQIRVGRWTALTPR